MHSISFMIWQMCWDLVLITWLFPIFSVSYDLPNKKDLEHNLKKYRILKKLFPPQSLVTTITT